MTFTPAEPVSAPRPRRARGQPFFAVASVGGRRWYWVVWPAPRQLGSRRPTSHLAHGYERTKAAAVARALEAGGAKALCVAARYAREYHHFNERLSQYALQPPPCLARLNLTFPCTAADVRRAYRKMAKRLHPDQGGQAEEFLALQTAYEQALALCRE